MPNAQIPLAGDDRKRSIWMFWSNQHGLGHCMLLSSTIDFDNALTQLVVNTNKLIIANKAVNLVYDSIDFGEDVKKQTHITNGIITQQIGSKNVRTSYQDKKRSNTQLRYHNQT